MITTRNTTIIQIDISVPVVDRYVSLSCDRKGHEGTYRVGLPGRCGCGSGGSGGRIGWLVWAGLQAQAPLREPAKKVLSGSQVRRCSLLLVESAAEVVVVRQVLALSMRASRLHAMMANCYIQFQRPYESGETCVRTAS